MELAQALLSYDEQYKDRLIKAVLEAIFVESIIVENGQHVCTLRTAEIARALETVMAAALAMSPTMDVPSHLREETDNIAKRLRKNVAKARAEGTFNIFGAAKGGNA